MSVRTTADEKLDEIRQDLRALYRKLLLLYDDGEVWGRKDFSAKFEDDLELALDHVRSAKKLLD